MVRVVIESGHSVTLGGISLQGPLSFDADALPLGSETITSGVVVMAASGNIRTADYHPAHLAAPYWMALLFVLGLFYSAKVFR